MLKRIYIMCKLAGFDFYLMWMTLRGLPAFVKDTFSFASARKKNKNFSKFTFYPILSDRYSSAGVGKGHYFHQDLWVAQNIFANNPVKHVDIGSRLDGFVAHVAAYRQIEVFDIRPYPEAAHNNIKFVQADLTLLDERYINYCDSLSCLHALEHFGLGRYGDPIDANGYVKGFNNMHQMLKPGGLFYFSVPIGPQRVDFNAQRVFSISYLLSLFSGKYSVVNFSYVNDAGDIYKNVSITEQQVATNYGCYFGCGIFVLQKL